MAHALDDLGAAQIFEPLGDFDGHPTGRCFYGYSGGSEEDGSLPDQGSGPSLEVVLFRETVRRLG